MAREINNLEEVLNRIDASLDDHAELSLGMILEAVGGRSFGPLLLVVGLITASPLSGFPGMPTSVAIVILLMATQLLFGKDHIWLPRWFLRRSVQRSRVRRALRYLRPVTHQVDRLLRQRLPFFIEGHGIRVIALACIVIAFVLPVMELVPFSAHIAGLALSAFGLALIARDGLLALIAFVATAGTFSLFILQWLG